MFCCNQVVTGLDMDPVEDSLTVIKAPDYGLSAPANHFVFQSVGISSIGEGTDLDVELPGVEIVMGQEAMVICIAGLIGDCLAQGANSDPGCTFPDYIQLPGCSQAQIDDPASGKGASVVDPDHHFPTVFKVFDQHHGL